MRFKDPFKASGIYSCFIALFWACLCTSCISDPPEKNPFILDGDLGFQSANIVVDDLALSRGYFKDTLGFSFIMPEQNGSYSGSRMASIPLPDFSGLHLISLNDTVAEAATAALVDLSISAHPRIWPYTLHSSSADSVFNWLSARDFPMDSIQHFRSIKEIPGDWSFDSGEAEQLGVSFSSEAPAYYPRFVEDPMNNFIFADFDQQSMYAFYRGSITHDNGVTGLAEIRLSTNDIEADQIAFTKMGFINSTISEKDVVFELNQNQRLVLIEDKKDAGTYPKQETAMKAIRFYVKSLDSTYQFLREKLPEQALIMKTGPDHLVVDRNYASGVQLEFIRESEERSNTIVMSRPGEALSPEASEYAAGMYSKYCALCHGDDRQGYAADNAPSLRSHSLLAASNDNNFMRYTIKYGREGTAMGGFATERGGPMNVIDVELMLRWLYEKSGVQDTIQLSREPVVGDTENGAAIYSKHCASCHGEQGEGITAPALGNQMLLATATDHFLRYVVSEGREDTPMVGFKDSLSNTEIDDVTAFLRTRASGWDVPSRDTIPVPLPENYVLNPENETPEFNLREGLYVPAEEVLKAMKSNKRMVILDARSEVAWRQTHIPGSVPVPYYEEPESFIEYMPEDDTWIVVYCACPHAASLRVLKTLRRYGFSKTAIIDEGILVWAQMGYPVSHGN